MGPRAGVEDAEKRNSLNYRDSNSGLSVVQVIATRCTDCVTAIITEKCRKATVNSFPCNTALRPAGVHLQPKSVLMTATMMFPGRKCTVTQIANYICIVPPLRLKPHIFITYFNLIVAFWVKVGSQVVNVFSGFPVASYF